MIGTYIWTICSAGWVVIAYITQLPEAAITAVLCGGMAYFWSKAYDN